MWTTHFKSSPSSGMSSVPLSATPAGTWEQSPRTTTVCLHNGQRSSHTCVRKQASACRYITRYPWRTHTHTKHKCERLSEEGERNYTKFGPFCKWHKATHSSLHCTIHSSQILHFPNLHLYFRLSPLKAWKWCFGLRLSHPVPMLQPKTLRSKWSTNVRRITKSHSLHEAHTN
jgi:hypothetical protein